MPRNIQEWLNEGYVQVRVDAGTTDVEVGDDLQLVEGLAFNQDGTQLTGGQQPTVEDGMLRLETPTEYAIYFLAKKTGKGADILRDTRPTGRATGDSGEPDGRRKATDAEKKAAEEAEQQIGSEEQSKSPATDGPVPQRTVGVPSKAAETEPAQPATTARTDGGKVPDARVEGSNRQTGDHPASELGAPTSSRARTAPPATAAKP